MSKPNEFKFTIGEEKVLYISTLSDLGGDMLKLDFPMGEYVLYSFNQGYYLGVKDYSPKNEDAIQIFNDRDGHKGLAGTYYDGETDNVHRVRIFNNYISENLREDWWKYNSCEFESDEFEISQFETDDSETDESRIDDSKTDDSVMDVSKTYESFCEYKRGKVKDLKLYNNIPVFFYLTKQITIDDLNNIELECASGTNDCGNVTVCWYVFHSKEGRIGIAVQQKEFHNMMGDQAGLCLFSSNGYRAVGNFNFYDNNSNDKTEFNEYVMDSRHVYECEFKTCFCDVEYESARKRRLHWENLMKNKGCLVK